MLPALALSLTLATLAHLNLDSNRRQLKPRLRQALQAAGLDPDTGSLTLLLTMTVLLGRRS